MSELGDYDLQNYNFSRQQVLTQQTSTNASQDFERQSMMIMQKETKKRESTNKRVKDNSNTTAPHIIQQSEPQHYEFTEVFVWGDDRWGQLGLYHQKLKKGNKDQASFKLPKTCSFNILIKQISCGENHSAILTNQGHLYMMGSNVDGQLGIGENCPDLLNKDCAGAPCLVDKLRDYKVQSVECGKNFTLAIVQDKNNNGFNGACKNQVIFGWGCNKEGQLGISSNTLIDLPTKLHFFEPQNIQLKQISAGLQHTLFLTEQGQVYATGSNSQGQLGIGQQYNQVIQPILLDIFEDQEIIQVSSGDHHSLFLTSNGQVYACGNNQLCQLGISEGNAIEYLPIPVKSLQNYKIVKVNAKQESAAISSSGELFLWGSGVFGTYKTPQKILTISNPVCDVSLGSSLGTCLDSKGLLWTWGQNQMGELGVGDLDSRIHPYPVLTLKGKKVTQIQCGGSFVIALGQIVKKEIPQLKLKKQRESSSGAVNNMRVSSQIVRNSSQKSIGNRSLSKSKKKRTSSSSKFFRRDSINSLNKIYGGSINLNAVQRLDSDAHSPRLSKESKLSKILKKKSLLNKSKLQDSIPKSTKPKLKLKKSSSKVPSAQPFSGEETTIIKSGILNQSCLVVKNKNKLSLANKYQQYQPPVSYTQNQTKLEDYSKNYQNLDINHSSQDITNDSQIINQQLQQQQQQVMYIPQPLQTHTNKEKLIKDLNTEMKQLRTENELLRKENRQVKQQMEQLEKHYEKQNIAQQHQQELQNLHAEIQRQEQKANKLKNEKNDIKNQCESQQQQILQQEQLNIELKNENQELNNQLQSMSDEYRGLQGQYQESQNRNEEYEREIKDIQSQIMQISQQSTQVEKSLMDKLQSVSEKYQDAQKQIEELNYQIKSDKKKLDDITYSAKDTQFYVNALEKENTFLRQEIEKVKYGKDKDQYGKFLQNLIPIRNANKKSSQINYSENEDNLKQSVASHQAKSPFRESTTSSNIKNNFSYDKHCDILSDRKIKQQQIDEPQIIKSQQQESIDLRKSQISQKENDNNVDISELRMSYNQKLLKSLEKKTLNKHIR